MVKYWISLILLIAGLTPWAPSARAAELIPIGARACTLAGNTLAGNTLAGNTLAIPGSSAPGTLFDPATHFDCSDQRFEVATDNLWIRIDVRGVGADLIDPVLRARTSRHGAIDLYRHFGDGGIVASHHSLADMTARWRSPSAIALPFARSSDGVRPDQLLIRVTRPFDPPNWADLELVSAGHDRALDRRSRMISALVAGLLAAPLLLNLVLFAALRQRFIVFHTLMITALIINHVAWTGLLFDLFPAATMVHRSVTVYLALALAGFAGCLLVRSLAQPQILGRWGRMALVVAGSGCLIITSLVMVFSPWIPYVGSQIFHASFGLMALTVVGTLVWSAVRGDRVALLQLTGFSGIVIVGACRILRATGIIGDLPILDLGFYFAVLVEAFATATVVSLRALQLRREHDRALADTHTLRRLADTDGLTGLLNRRALIDRFESLGATGNRRAEHWSLILLDIDFFKRINDTWGHVVGDAVLREVSRRLSAISREGDLVARIGGEEFALLIAASKHGEALALAERIRADIASKPVMASTGQRIEVRISIGIADIPRQHICSFDTVFAAADAALYEAKAGGRNRVSSGRVHLLDTAPEWRSAAAEFKQAG